MIAIAQDAYPERRTKDVRHESCDWLWPDLSLVGATFKKKLRCQARQDSKEATLVRNMEITARPCVKNGQTGCSGGRHFHKRAIDNKRSQGRVMNTTTGSVINPAVKSACGLVQRRETSAANDAATAEPLALSREAAALSRAYSPYVLGIGSRISEVEVVSHHIRRRRYTMLVRGITSFSLKVIVITAGIILGTVSQQQPMPGSSEAVHMLNEQIVPAGLGIRDKSDQTDPVIDEMPPGFVYT